MIARRALILAFFFRPTSTAEAFIASRPRLTVNGMVLSRSMPSHLHLEKNEEDAQGSDDPIPGNKKITIPKPIRVTIEAAYTVFSLGLTTVCVGLTFGLALNIFGYGYQIDRSGTPSRTLDENKSNSPLFHIRIDTIQQFRTENQFKREVQESMLERRNKMSATDGTFPSSEYHRRLQSEI